MAKDKSELSEKHTIKHRLAREKENLMKHANAAAQHARAKSENAKEKLVGMSKKWISEGKSMLSAKTEDNEEEAKLVDNNKKQGETNKFTEPPKWAKSFFPSSDDVLGQVAAEQKVQGLKNSIQGHFKRDNIETLKVNKGNDAINVNLVQKGEGDAASRTLNFSIGKNGKINGLDFASMKDKDIDNTLRVLNSIGIKKFNISNLSADQQRRVGESIQRVNIEDSRQTTKNSFDVLKGMRRIEGNALSYSGKVDKNAMKGLNDYRKSYRKQLNEMRNNNQPDNKSDVVNKNNMSNNNFNTKSL